MPDRSHRRSASSRRVAARKRRGNGIVVLAGILILILGGGLFVGAKVGGYDGPPFSWFTEQQQPAADYAGPGGDTVIVEIEPGMTSEPIADVMAEKDVVASSAAFYEAALDVPAMNNVMPGYYAMKSQMSAEEAVALLVDPASQVGHVVISEGRLLHDTRDVTTDAVYEGIYTKIAAASCFKGNCVTYDDLNAAGAGSDLDALGVPEWAQDAVGNVPDKDRQLEGLIAAGSLDFDPTATPTDILKQLVESSAESYAETGIAETSVQGLSPYQLLIAASLVERESHPTDFPKVARVILNRLAVGQRLEFDSTVNYALDETEVATTDADRGRQTPWNTYAMAGLPATPISSPSLAALEAMENPAAGDWLYFVTVNNDGTTNFTQSYDEHLRNVELATQNGVLDSGR
ncbi:endolytic transglycosylase MltG [Antrihabitans sp. YC2-6]|nr:endolytic transglycosylase MltG [Antrihabitans sp. YC2-6]